jgi:hypothetical protein
VICVVGTVGPAILGDWASLGTTTWPLLFFGVLVYALFWASHHLDRRARPHGGEHLPHVFLPWAALQRIDPRDSLTLLLSALLP